MSSSNQKVMPIITEQYELDKAIESISKYKLVFMDTEFERRNTYHPKLCLVQIATLSKHYLIDGLANIDLSRVVELMTSKKILKVFHSASQDVLLFHQVFGAIPRNIFDTQVAAAVCGFGKALGYQQLCKMLLDINLDKSMQNSDWAYRPLPLKQIEYAISDVIHLIPLHDKLEKALRRENLWETYKAEMTKALSQDRITFSPERLVTRFYTSELTVQERSNLVNLIAFREDCAKSLDIPRNHFIEDRELVKIARRLPGSLHDLDALCIQKKSRLYQQDYRQKLVLFCLDLRKTGKSNP